MRTSPLLALVLATVAAGLGCESGTPVGPGPTDPADPGVLASITVIPNVTALGGGRTLRLTAKVRNRDGSTSTPVGVAWQSEDGDIATVDAAGLVYGLRPGRVQIVATWRDSRGSSLVTVFETVAKKPTPRCLEKDADGAASGALSSDQC
jgi:hypothetical protein